MEFFRQRIDKTVIDTLNHVVESDFIRLPYTDAVEILRGLRAAVRVPGRVGSRPPGRA